MILEETVAGLSPLIRRKIPLSPALALLRRQAGITSVQHLQAGSSSPYGEHQY